MKYCVIILFVGLAVQLEASALQQAKYVDKDADVEKEGATSSTSTPLRADSAADQKQQDNDSDEEADIEVRVNRSVQSPKERKWNAMVSSLEARRYLLSKHDKTTGSDVRRRHSKQRRSTNSDDNQVIAFGLDTGAPDSKNELVQAISEAFGGLDLHPQHARSNVKGEKHEPVALELKSESLLRSLEKFLASSQVKKLTRDLARKAAVIYRAFEKEI